MEISLTVPKHQLLLIFSLYTNGRSLFACKISATGTSNSRLNCLNGIRVLSMLYLVIGHIVFIMLCIPIQNSAELKAVIDNGVKVNCDA